ncbi:MAG: sigma-70 family RNA polymerase sigma factor, partial [Limisphaerales bacterium]
AMPVAELTDVALMERIKLGDREAFEELVTRFRQPVMNLIMRTVSDATEAEDLSQCVFVQIYKAAGRYKPTAKVSTWIFTIARNLGLNEIRRRKRHPAESMETQLEGDDADYVKQFEDRSAKSPGHDALSTELSDLVDVAVRDLPENQRTAILLCREGDLSYDDIAEIMDTSLASVKSLIFRGRETLKKRLKPYLKTGTWEGEARAATN